MAKVSIKITDEQIEAKKASFLSDISKKSELAKNGRSSPTQIFLEKIKDVVKVAIDSGLGYKEISRSIYGQWNVRISEQTLRAFAQNALGVEKKQKTKIDTKQGIKEEEKTTAQVAPKAETPTDGVKQSPANFDDI